MDFGQEMQIGINIEYITCYHYLDNNSNIKKDSNLYEMNSFVFFIKW